MKRFIAGTAIVVAMLSSASAFAANSTPVKTTPISSTLMHKASTTNTDYSAHCATLAGEWKSAEMSNASNAHLGKAKADAAKAEKQCKSTKASDEKKGVANYESALKLLGVSPT